VPRLLYRFLSWVEPSLRPALVGQVGLEPTRLSQRIYRPITGLIESPWAALHVGPGAICSKGEMPAQSLLTRNIKQKIGHE
jgi:hypothetical protein